MTKDDFSALCALCKATGFKTLGELQFMARNQGVNTNSGLLDFVERLWEMQRGAALPSV